MLPVLASALRTLAQNGQPVPLDRFRTPAALLMGITIFTIVFATLWLMAARRRARAEAGKRPRRRAKLGGAWAESARRLRIPPDDTAGDGTRDIDPSDLSPDDVDLRPDDDDDPHGGKDRP